ncbi:unnamed protein product, partial [Adineta steineri]
MDSLCEQIDKLTINYLEEFGQLISCKQILEDTIRQGYFNISHARVIMGVNNLSYLQYSEKDPMIASTKISISSSPFQIEKQTDKEHCNDTLKWFGLLTPNMSEPKRIQVIRPHQNINEFIYQTDTNPQSPSYNQILLNQQDYHQLGWKRLNRVQSLPLKDNWPIVAGNAIATFSSGFLGGLITHRMARNLSLNITASSRPATGACFLVVTVAHLSAYYYTVLQPMFSGDPRLCTTCLEIRSFALGTFLPITMGATTAVLLNLSSCLLNKTLHLPQFNIRAYPEWRQFFRQHAFKGMAHRHFFAYPLINGFLASMVFLGQHYYWKNYLQQQLETLSEQSSSSSNKEPKKRVRPFGVVQDFFAKLFSNKMPEKKTVTVQTGTSTLTLLLVAIAGGIVAVSLQPLILLAYSHVGLQIIPTSYSRSPNTIPFEQVSTSLPLTTTVEPGITTMEQEMTTPATTASSSPPSTTTTATTTITTTTTAKSIVIRNDPTVDEDPIYLKDESLTIKVPETTTVKPIVTEKPKESKSTDKKKVDKSEKTSQSVKLEKVPQSPEIIDVTGRNKEIPDEVKNFKSTRINMIKTKKLWIPIPKSNGGHRRVPPVSIRAGKEHDSSIKHWLFEEFLSHDECSNLIKVHKEHVKKMKEIDPIICFDSIQTLRKHLTDLQPNTTVHVTPNDFTKGTTCVNATFSSTLKQWGLKWSYSTAFYLGESPFSTLLSKRIEEGTELQSTHGGKFQITSTDKGVGYKAHRDCTLDGLKQDRYATFLAYLNTVMEGGETEFQDLEIKIKPKEGRVIVWNNMNENGECEEKSIHSANIVGDEEGKFVLQRWYYYENFYSLGKRPPEPDIPERKPGQAQVSCDEYDMGSCRAYGYSDDLNLRNLFSKAAKTSQDQNILTQLEQSLPKFLDLDIPSSENVDKVFSKFKEAVRLLPANIQRETPLDTNTARNIFPGIQPIYRYIKESVWKSILKLIDLPRELLQIPAQNLADANLNNLLSYSDDDTVSKVLEYNSNRQDFSDEQKTILVQNYINRIKSKLNPSNFQQLITEKLGASFLRYLPIDFLAKDPIFNDNSVIRNIATWLHFLDPIRRDAISNKVYRALTDTTGKIAQSNGPQRLTNDDTSSLNMIVRTMPSLSTRQIINAVGDKIVPLLDQSSIRDDQSCTTALALLNRTIESKRTSNRYFRPTIQLVQHWQECYSGCDLSDLFTNREDLKELLKSHPSPESCDNLVSEVKKEYGLERDISANKLREVSDAFGSIYRADEINNLSDELMAELGRDEKTLEKLGSQDLTPNEARSIINKIPRSTQNLWGKNMLGKLGNLIPGLDDIILKQILTRGRGDLPSLFNSTSPLFIRKLVPSKIRLLIDQYATEPNLAKYRQLLASDHAKKYIKSETLMKIFQLAPDVLRLIRFTPAQASAAIANRLGSERNFDGNLSSLGTINNFLNGLTKTDIEKV